jgi:hypothetical protein
VIVEGIRVEKDEKASLDQFMPSSPGARLLGKILLAMEDGGLTFVRDPGQGLDSIRYWQGYLAAVGELHRKLRKISNANWFEGDIDEEAEKEEEDINVDF